MKNQYQCIVKSVVNTDAGNQITWETIEHILVGTACFEKRSYIKDLTHTTLAEVAVGDVFLARGLSDNGIEIVYWGATRKCKVLDAKVRSSYCNVDYSYKEYTTENGVVKFETKSDTNHFESDEFPEGKVSRGEEFFINLIGEVVF